MKKMPTLFHREFEGHTVKSISREPLAGLEWVLEGEGIATEKLDGACCAVIGGKFYSRYDAKRGKTPPPGAIACCDPDPVTGHWPHWVPVESGDPSSLWFISAYHNTDDGHLLPDGTYEAIGPHFQKNPYHLDRDVLERHGEREIVVPRDFDGLRQWLKTHWVEGIVFWKDNEPRCKIKRSDFGFRWGTDFENTFGKEDQPSGS